MIGARRRITVGLAAATLGLVALAAAGEPVPLAVEGSGGWLFEPPRSDNQNDSDSDDESDATDEDARANH